MNFISQGKSGSKIANVDFDYLNGPYFKKGSEVLAQILVKQNSSFSAMCHIFAPLCPLFGESGIRNQFHQKFCTKLKCSGPWHNAHSYSLRPNFKLYTLHSALKQGA